MAITAIVAHRPIVREVRQWVWDYTDPWEELTANDYRQSQSEGKYTIVITHASWMPISDKNRLSATRDEDLHWWLWEHRSSVDAYLVDITEADSRPKNALIDLGLRTDLIAVVYAPDGSVVWQQTFLSPTQIIQALEQALTTDQAADP